MSTRALLGDRSFRLLWSAHTISSFGDALTSLALLVTAQRLTGSTTAVAATAIAIALPQVVVGLFAGVLVDRWNRKRVMIVADVGRAVLVLGFLAVTAADRLWLLYVLAFAQSAIGTFFGPARATLVAELLPADRLLPANSFSEMSRVVAGVAGVGAAGVLASASTLSIVFVVDAVTFLVSAVLVALVRTEHVRRDDVARGAFGELAAGLRIVFGSRVLLGVVAAGSVAMLGLGAVNVLLVPLVVGELDAAEAWFGPLEAAQVSAMVAAATLVATFSSRLRPTRLVSLGALGLGASVVGLAACTAPWQLMIPLFAAGWFLAPLQASVTTLAQTAVPANFRARTQAAFVTVVSGASLVSMCTAGLVADAVGVRGVLVASGVIVAVAGVVSAAAFRGTEPRSPTTALEAP